MDNSGCGIGSRIGAPLCGLGIWDPLSDYQSHQQIWAPQIADPLSVVGRRYRSKMLTWNG